MNAKEIRCQMDLELFEKLKDNQEVQQATGAIARQEGERSTTTRRKLLSRSVRLSRAMAPDVHRMADECTRTLGTEIPLELYVFPAPEFNAVCFKPEDGRLFIMFSSSLLEAFTEEELKFVLGHELGHNLYGHHDIPIGYLLGGNIKPDPALVLELFTWSRYAEISADRAGAFCTHNLEDVAKALFKLASGLSGKVIRFDLGEFLQQIDDMRMEDSDPDKRVPEEDWFSTHPFSPLRVKALQLFDESKYQRKNGKSRAELEVGVQGLMSLMEPSYIEGKTESATHMRRLLYAGAIAVADANGDISDEEIALFEQFFGSGEFSRNLDLPRLIADLPERAKTVRQHASVLQRMQVLRDLCLMARASGEVLSEEVRVLHEIADQVNIARSFITQTIAQQVEPD